MRLALVVLVSALGLAAAQPALASGTPDPKLAGLIASCKARSSSDALKECVTAQLKTTKLSALVASCKARTSGDAWKECLKTQLTAAGKERDFDPAKVAQSLCQSELGAKLGDGCVARLSALIGSCKARSSGDGWKDCLKSQLPAPPENNGTAGFDPASAAQSLCQGPLGVKLGEGCVTKLTAVFDSCKGQASGAADTFKACVTAQLPAAETRTK